MEAHYVCIVFDWSSFVFRHAIYSKCLRAFFFIVSFHFGAVLSRWFFNLCNSLPIFRSLFTTFYGSNGLHNISFGGTVSYECTDWLKRDENEARKITFIKEQITFMLTSYRNWAKSRRKWWMKWKDSKKITNYNTYTYAYMHKAHTSYIILRLCDDHHHRLGHKSMIWTSYSSIAQVICCQSTITSRIHIFSANNALFKLKHSFLRRIWRGKWIENKNQRKEERKNKMK